MLLADLFITAKDRPKLLSRSLESLNSCTPRDQYRLTLVQDGPGALAITDKIPRPDYILSNSRNAGLGPSINMALAHIDALKRWEENPPPFTVYVQDDVLYSAGWLERLSKMFLLFEKQHKLGFASGVECIEHPPRKDLGGGMILKDWIRATCMFARHEYWMSMWPIPRIDPETGRERGRPHDGLGSSVDWWFIRNHPNSVCRSGRTNLVIPGLLQHLGYKESTWLKRELPESESDKKIIEGSR